MSFRSLLMSGVVAAAVVGMAQSAAAYGPANFQSSETATAAWSQVVDLSAGQYTLSLLWTSLSRSVNTNSAIEFGAYLLDSGQTVIASATSTTRSTAGGSVLSDVFSIATAGQYTLQFAASHNAVPYMVNGAEASIAAVPGPIAAAGLPGVLGLIGFGLYRRNRRVA